MADKPETTTYSPITIDERVELPVMVMTGKSKQKYMILPDEYFDVEHHVLLDGVTLIPMQDTFNEVDA